MTQFIEVKEIKDGKARIRLNSAEWWIEPGEAIKISTPNINVYQIGEDKETGKRYQGPISLPYITKQGG